jgi:hypothetical protein
MNLHSLFANSRHIQQFKAGTTIFTEGTPGDTVYVHVMRVLVQRLRRSMETH